MTRPKNKDQKKLEKLLINATETAKNIGLSAFGLGRSIAFIAVDPKGSAAQIQMAAGHFLIIAEDLTALSQDIKTWDDERIIAEVAKPLVGVDGKPLS